MKNLLAIVFLAFITTTCIGCNNSYTHTSRITGEPYTQVQAISKENLPEVYITATGKKYHNKNCNYLKYTKCKTSLADAKDSGFTPCSVCNP